MNTGQYTHQEIYSQPKAWSAALDVMWAQKAKLMELRNGGYQQVIFTGCGSTYYLGWAAALVLQELTGIPARGIPASELWLSPKSAYTTGKTLLVPVSRSGYTTETLRACEAFLEAGRGDILTFSCYGEKPLAQMGKVNIVLPSGQEESVAQTRAFSTLYLGTVAFAALWAGRNDLVGTLPQLYVTAERMLKEYAGLAAEWGKNMFLDRFYFLGSGLRYPLACELSLKMKEMSLSHSEPFHFLEFRHGPKSMVTESTLVVGLLSEQNRNYEEAVLQDMRALGGNILTIGETGCDISFHSGVEEVIRNILILPLGQLMALERALAKDLNPDRPNNLSAVIEL